jgi:hypothetical protein
MVAVFIRSPKCLKRQTELGDTITGRKILKIASEKLLA